MARGRQRRLAVLAARPRLWVAVGIGLVVAALLPDMRIPTRLLLVWDVGAGIYLALVLGMMARATQASMQRRADRADAGAALVLAVSIAAALASLAAIGAELRGLKDVGGPPELGRLALAGVTILLSWLFVHVTFALHYAHDFYAGADDRRGVRFPGTCDPDYWDFLYFAFNIGAAGQTSDVVIEARRMRRFALVHTILSFLFNTTILALAINVGASLL